MTCHVGARCQPSRERILRKTRQGFNSLRVEGTALRMVHDAGLFSLAISICRSWVSSKLNTMKVVLPNVTSSSLMILLVNSSTQSQQKKQISGRHLLEGKSVIPDKRVSTRFVIGRKTDSEPWKIDQVDKDHEKHNSKRV